MTHWSFCLRIESEEKSPRKHLTALMSACLFDQRIYLGNIVYQAFLILVYGFGFYYWGHLFYYYQEYSDCLCQVLIFCFMRSKIIFCGDFNQTDLQKTNEKNGLHDFLRILEEMEEFNCTEFTLGDIVRSGFVRSYLINKTKLGIGME